jgi:hypothetical protein
MRLLCLLPGEAVIFVLRYVVCCLLCRIWPRIYHRGLIELKLKSCSKRLAEARNEEVDWQSQSQKEKKARWALCSNMV